MATNHIDIYKFPSRREMTISTPQYIVTCRTTVSDIMCTTNTSAVINEDSVPKKFKHLLELKANLPYTKPFSLSSTHKLADPTPMQKLKFRGHRKQINDDLIKEKLFFFKQLEMNRFRKLAIETSAAVMIQSLFRGYRKRPSKPGKTEYEMRRYHRLHPSRKALQLELSSIASSIGLTPIAGLTLPAPLRLKKTSKWGKFEIAAAIRLQCFFRMLVERLKYQKKKHACKMEKLVRAFRILSKFIKYCLKAGQKERQLQVMRSKAAKVIQSLYRVFVSRQWVRRVRNLKRMNRRESDAAIRIKRNLFLRGISGRKTLVSDYASGGNTEK